MSVQKKILKSIYDMTKLQQVMAKYVLDHGELVAFMTAKQLADELDQSDASVIRFARTLGYNGFLDLREDLRQSVLDKVGAKGLHQQSVEKDDHSLLNHLLQTDVEILEQTSRLNNTEVLVSIADNLLAADRISVSGHSTSYPLAAYLSMHLNHCLGNSQIFNIGVGDLAERFRTVGPGDVFIGIGYVRYLPYTIEIMRLARESGAHIVAITDRPSSPLAELAHQTLFVFREVSHTIWWSQTGTLLIANSLISLVMARGSERVEKQLQRADDELTRIGLWRSSTTQ